MYNQSNNFLYDGLIILLIFTLFLLGIMYVPIWLYSFIDNKPIVFSIDNSLCGITKIPNVPACYKSTMPNILYWITLVILVLSTTLIVVWAYSKYQDWKRQKNYDPAFRPGMASKKDIINTVGKTAIMKIASKLRPELSHPQITDVAFKVGKSRGVEVYIPVENSIALIGPARQGKGVNVILPLITESPGAVVSTSLRTENLEQTLDKRIQFQKEHNPDGEGEIALFIPDGLDSLPVSVRQTAQKYSTKWSLYAGCRKQEVAIRRAIALVSNGVSSSSGGNNDKFWLDSAEQIVAPLLMAADLANASLNTFKTWLLSPERSLAAVEILIANDDYAIKSWGYAIQAMCDQKDSRTRSNMWVFVSNCLAKPIKVSSICEAINPENGKEIDVRSFIKNKGTLYIICDSKSIAAPLVAALIEEIYAVAYELANQSKGNRLDPPIHISLDEVANIAFLPSLGSMMSAGGGAGIFTLVAIQSLSQAESKWGLADAKSMWEAATSRIVLGGVMNSDIVNIVSSLCGEYDKPVVTKTGAYGLITPAHYSTSTQKERVLPPDYVRNIPMGKAVYFTKSVPPIPINLLPVWKR